MVEGKITEQQYVAAMALHQSRHSRIIFLICACAGIVAVAIWLLGMWVSAAIVLLAASIGGAIGHWLWDRLYIPARAAKLYRQSADFAAPFKIAWDADTVELWSEKGSWRRSWSEYVKRRENDELVLLYINDQLFNLFPRDMFGSEANWKSFKEQARRVPTRTTLPPPAE